MRLLDQIDSPSSSRALAALAVSGLTEGVRGHAADSLLKRDPREFAGPLIAVIRDPIEFEVREVQGPGRPGELYVHGERMNRRFFYEAPPPLATLRPTDIVGFDSNGLPVANRIVGFTLEPAAAAVNPLMTGAPDLSNAPQVLGHLLGPAGTALGQKMYQNQQTVANSTTINSMGNVMMPLTYPIPVGQLRIQAEQKAAASKRSCSRMWRRWIVTTAMSTVSTIGRLRRLRPHCSKRTGRSEKIGSSGSTALGRD